MDIDTVDTLLDEVARTYPPAENGTTIFFFRHPWHDEPIKITLNPDRADYFSDVNPEPLLMMHEYKCDQAADCCAALQSLFSQNQARFGDEWFELSRDERDLVVGHLTPTGQKGCTLAKKRAFRAFVIEFSVSEHELKQFLCDRAKKTMSYREWLCYIEDVVQPASVLESD
jgi:hypothetical protein